MLFRVLFDKSQFVVEPVHLVFETYHRSFEQLDVVVWYLGHAWFAGLNFNLF